MSDFEVTRHNLQNGEIVEEGLPTTLNSGNTVNPLCRAHAHSSFIAQTASMQRNIPWRLSCSETQNKKHAVANASTV